MSLGAQGRGSNSGNGGSSWRYEYSVLKALQCIIDNTGALNPEVPVVETPTMLRSSAPGATPAGIRTASFFNAGLATATVLGANLLMGEQVSFDAAENNTLTAIAYDGTGTDLLITYII